LVISGGPQQRSILLTRALILQGLLPLKGLRLSRVGTAGFAFKRVDVLTVDPDKDGRPAISYFAIAQDKAVDLLLSEYRYYRDRYGEKEPQNGAPLRHDNLPAVGTRRRAAMIEGKVRLRRSHMALAS
jgi:hypothetical protein